MFLFLNSLCFFLSPHLICIGFNYIYELYLILAYFFFYFLMYLFIFNSTVLCFNKICF